MAYNSAETFTLSQTISEFEKKLLRPILFVVRVMDLLWKMQFFEQFYATLPEIL